MCKKSILLFMLLFTTIFGYGSNGHSLITKLSIEYLSSQNKHVPYNELYDHIIMSSPEPDGTPLSAPEINHIFPGLNYNFNRTIASAFRDAWIKFFFTKTTGGNIAFMGTGVIVSDLVSNKIFNEANPADIENLMTSTQHTLVGYNATDDPIANLPEFSGTIRKISIADYCAEVEYTYAVAAWKAGNRNEAMRRLGRSLHYVQDITTPHHTNLTINLSDITRFALAKLDEHYLHQYFSPDDPDNMEYSQAKFDDIGYEIAEGIDYTKPFESDVFEKWYLSNDDFRNKSIRELMRNTRKDIIGTGLIAYADGYGNGGYTRGFLKDLWNKVKDFFKEEVIDPIKDTVAGLLAEFLESRMRNSYFYRNIPEDPNRVANEFVPLAIVRSAQIIEKFYYETENWTGQIDMTPINMLLLD